MITIFIVNDKGEYNNAKITMYNLLLDFNIEKYIEFNII